MSTIMLSPVGTSTFTKGNFPREIHTYSNCRSKEEIPPEAREKIEAYIAETHQLVMNLSTNEIKQRSAELNGIVQYYQGIMENARADTHILLPSDTYIGKAACQIVESYLKRYCNDVRLLEIKDLQTQDGGTFQYALSGLAKEIMTIKEGMYQGQKLVFNLTGGFKAILGFLQSLGMFYADETVYVFEFSDSLLRIPPLPVKLVPDEYLKDYSRIFRRLDRALPVQEAECSQIPASLVLCLFDETTLSIYGKIVWDNFRRDLYSSRLLDSPSELIQYTKKFVNTVQEERNEKAFYELNSRMDDLAVYLEKGRKNMPKSLDLKQLKLDQGISTHEFDAWADRDAKRVFCHYKEGVLVLDELGAGLH
ncbi:MAG: putative CRISPR-associated protein [Candidatus Cloacimonetes bacterium]|nr:putative CRISPR-associated protein [Candidatus Cloacimonadota bacterium]